MLKIPPPVIAVSIAIGMWLLSRHFPIYSFNSDWIKYPGYFLIAIGLALDLAGAIQFHRAKTTINPLKPENSSTVVTHGVYRISRNPMYLGMLSVLCGLAFLLHSLSGFFLLPVFAVVINHLQIIPEEKMLLSLFGDSYQQYLDTVNRWI